MALRRSISGSEKQRKPQSEEASSHCTVLEEESGSEREKRLRNCLEAVEERARRTALVQGNRDWEVEEGIESERRVEWRSESERVQSEPRGEWESPKEGEGAVTRESAEDWGSSAWKAEKGYGCC